MLHMISNARSTAPSVKTWFPEICADQAHSFADDNACHDEKRRWWEGAVLVRSLNQREYSHEPRGSWASLPARSDRRNAPTCQSNLGRHAWCTCTCNAHVTIIFRLDFQGATLSRANTSQYVCNNRTQHSKSSVQNCFEGPNGSLPVHAYDPQLRRFVSRRPPDQLGCTRENHACTPTLSLGAIPIGLADSSY
jgi:hypothetical protein